VKKAYGLHPVSTLVVLLGTLLCSALVSSCAHLSRDPNRTPQEFLTPGDGWYCRFCECRLSPDSGKYKKMWSNYDTLMEKKMRINMTSLNVMPVPGEMKEFLINLSRIAPIVTALDSIKTSAWLSRLYKDKTLTQLTSSTAFIATLEDPGFVSMNKDPSFQDSYSSDQNFRSAIDQMVGSLRDRSVQRAISYFQSNGLSFFQTDGMQSALKLINLYNLPADLLKVSYVSSLNELQKPSAFFSDSDVFTIQFFEILKASVVNYLQHNDVTPDGSVSTSQAAALNSIVLPDPDNAYQDYVVRAHENDSNDNISQTIYDKRYELNQQQIAAIDGVARTLIGEERSCEGADLHQFEAVGVAIANRALAIKNAQDENNQIQQRNNEIDVENVQMFLNTNDTSYLKKVAGGKGRGIIDFGIKGSNDLPVVQVITRKRQFDAWNSFALKDDRLSNFGRIPAGIPDFTFQHRVPWDRGQTDKNLINVLCPQISTNGVNRGAEQGWSQTFPSFYDDDFKRAVDIAALVVVDPERFREIYDFYPKPEGPAFFYTNAKNLPTTIRIPVGGLSYVDPATNKHLLQKLLTPSGVCSTLRVFSARGYTSYGVLR
jgi:hypothetical protein